MRVDLDTRVSNEFRADARPGAERTLSREAYAMLAQANLLRMRGCWPEAIEKCMAALRLSPDNPSAQSLLGDIYDNQGRLDDAIQWYRMALDVQPDSPADQIKLARLLDLKARDFIAQNAVKIEEPAPAAPAPPPPLRGLRRWRSNPDGLLRRIAFAAGALAVLIVLLALALVHHSGSLSLPGVSQQVHAPTVVVPSVADAPVAGSSSTAAAPVSADPSEISLLDALQASPALTNQGLSVVSVQSDPRIGRLTLTIACPPPAGTSLTRDLILRDATSVLQAAAQQADPQAVSQFTIRCLLVSTTGGSTPLVFTADATRPAISALNPNLTLQTTDQIAAAYTAPWWAPSLTQ